MWTLCNQANAQVQDTVWLKRSLDGEPATKVRVRELTYRALIEYLESLPENLQLSSD